MFDIGRICIKIAGRDAGQKCVVVDTDGDFVVIDGQTRRRKCNPKHLEATKETIDLKKGASHDEVKSAFQKLNIEIVDTKAKKATERPKKQKAKKVYAPKVEKKPTKATAPKKEDAKLEESKAVAPKEESKPAEKPPAKEAPVKAEKASEQKPAEPAPKKE